MEPISVYTREQAIEDGVLIRFEDYLREEATTAAVQLWQKFRR